MRRIAGAVALLAAISGCGAARPDGREVFRANGCGGCHTLAAAGARGVVGPDLDQTRPTAAVAYRWLTYGAGGMPSYRGVLRPGELDAVVRFVVESTRRR